MINSCLKKSNHYQSLFCTQIHIGIALVLRLCYFVVSKEYSTVQNFKTNVR